MSRRSPGEIREQKCSLFLIRVLDFSAEADRGLVPCRGVHQDSQSGHESSILEIRRSYEEEETKTIIFQTVLDIYRDRFLYRSFADGILHQQYQDENEVYHTILHEIGHSLGLGHSPYESDIMYTPHKYGVVSLSHRDASSIQWLYKLPLGISVKEFGQKYGINSNNIDDIILKIATEKLRNNEFEEVKNSIKIPQKDLMNEQDKLAEMKKYNLGLQDIKISSNVQEYIKKNPVAKIENIKESKSFLYKDKFTISMDKELYKCLFKYARKGENYLKNYLDLKDKEKSYKNFVVEQLGIKDKKIEQLTNENSKLKKDKLELKSKVTKMEKLEKLEAWLPKEIIEKFEEYQKQLEKEKSRTRGRIISRSWSNKIENDKGNDNGMEL